MPCPSGRHFQSQAGSQSSKESATLHVPSITPLTLRIKFFSFTILIPLLHSIHVLIDTSRLPAAYASGSQLSAPYRQPNGLM